MGQRKRSLKHGHGRSGKQTPEYNTWRHMKARCYNPKDPRYLNYGAKGVVVCEGWCNSYEAFLADMGRRPSPQHTLERINVYGNYEPGNCVWLVAELQARNQRQTKLTVEGVQLAKDWLAQGYSQQTIADLLGVSQTLISQIKLGVIWKDAPESTPVDVRFVDQRSVDVGSASL